MSHETDDGRFGSDQAYPATAATEPHTAETAARRRCPDRQVVALTCRKNDKKKTKCVEAVHDKAYSRHGKLSRDDLCKIGQVQVPSKVPTATCSQVRKCGVEPMCVCRCPGSPVTAQILFVARSQDPERAGSTCRISTIRHDPETSANDKNARALCPCFEIAITVPLSRPQRKRPSNGEQEGCDVGGSCCKTHSTRSPCRCLPWYAVYAAPSSACHSGPWPRCMSRGHQK